MVSHELLHHVTSTFVNAQQRKMWCWHLLQAWRSHFYSNKASSWNASKARLKFPALYTHFLGCYASEQDKAHHYGQVRPRADGDLVSSPEMVPCVSAKQCCTPWKESLPQTLQPLATPVKTMQDDQNNSSLARCWFDGGSWLFCRTDKVFQHGTWVVYTNQNDIHSLYGSAMGWSCLKLPTKLLHRAISLQCIPMQSMSTLRITACMELWHITCCRHETKAGTRLYESGSIWNSIAQTTVYFQSWHYFHIVLK